MLDASGYLICLLSVVCLYWSFAVPVAITDGPQDVQLTDEVIESGEVSFECAAKADDSTPVTINW